MSTPLFKEHSLEEHAQSLADYLPGGKLFIAKNTNGTNFRKYLRGLSYELQRFESALIEVTSEYDPRTTTEFITEWESSVGIPDDCFPGTGSLDERRRDVITKFMAIGVSTAQDFIDLAAFMGYEITIEHLADGTYYPPYNVPFTPMIGIPYNRYVWIVIGANVIANIPPYNVPFSLTSSTQTKLQCFFNKLKPAHTLIIFRNE